MTESLSRKIPIKNVYYMLAYAWDLPLSLQQKKLESESFNGIENLLASLFEFHLSLLIKRGLVKEYIENRQPEQLLKGKLLMADSIKERTMQHKKFICQYDELTDDIVINQLVKTALYEFIKIPTLSPKILKRLMRLRPYLQHIQLYNWQNSIFNQIKLKRHNQHYSILIHIAQLLYERKITQEQDGEITFQTFLNDKQLNTLFEKFLYRFYQKHLPTYKVHRPIIDWKLSGSENADALTYLPKMHTDIVIEDNDNNQVIMDAKFYKETLTKTQFDQERLYSVNLYQLFAYVMNSKFTGKKYGILIYPMIDQHIHVSYQIMNHTISACTVNLNEEWSKIEQRLLEIITPYLQDGVS
ncbi:5-methylcytosine restriction system specificity protein McrC [Lysinibacillus fusiformis]|uniref:5-methylcytosine restriction system specificity protein McrC n=1 Tax=Lysinibacillus fusiformis TaxID=28031 RepID=UPI0021BF51B3|nr:hypothetical protein [Lysinibacillus fusiformis]UXJ68176.1 hypothetical protein N5069_18870 [Lysinibacillus fusiformis]